MSDAALHLLLFILVANGVPILVRNVMGQYMAYPVDMGREFFDARPILGASKTWRGIFFSMLITALVAGITGYGLLVGVQVALLAMLGDMLSSFIKRRLDMRSSSRAPFLDQVPESLLPAYCMMSVFALQWRELVILVLAFIMLELLLSKIMYKLGVRRTPY